MNYYINGEIGWDVTLQNIQKEWKDDITDVYVNSLGGDVWEGIAIYNFLKERQITTHTNGVVASISSIIFLAGKERIVNQWDDFLIHLPFSFGWGNSDDMQKSTDELKKIENKLGKIYEAETSLTFDQAIEQMKKDEFVTPEWLKENGFVNEIKEFKAVATINNNHKQKMTNLTDNDKSWIEQKFSALASLFKPKAKIVQDANGEELDFPDVAPENDPQVGDKATYKGNPAEGEFTMPDGSVYVFTSGELTEIKPAPADNPDVEALKKENADLKAENETLKAEAAKQTEAFAKVQKEFTDFKNEFSAKFNYDPKREPETEPIVQRLNLRK